jgi:serine/threonine-protein kinase RsbW
MTAVAQRIELAIASRLEQASLVGTCIRALCVEAGLDDMSAYQVQTCTIEAVNNAIIHAYGRAPDQQVWVAWHSDGRTLRIEVSDTGASMRELPPAVEPDPFAESGRGWWIMRQWMDSAEYRAQAQAEDGRNSVILRKALA